MGLYFISFAQNRHEWSTCKTQESGLISNPFSADFYTPPNVLCNCFGLAPSLLCLEA
jgi:hypothetical protein